MSKPLELDARLTRFRAQRGAGISCLSLVHDLATSGRHQEAQQVIREAFAFDRGTAAHQLAMGFASDSLDWGTPEHTEQLWHTLGEASGIVGPWEDAWPKFCRLALETSSLTCIRLMAAAELLMLERDHAPSLPLLYTAAAYGHIEAALALGHHYHEQRQPLAAASWFCRAAEIDPSLHDDYIGGWAEYDGDNLPWTLEEGCRDARLLGELIAAATPDDAQRIARLATDRPRQRLPPLPERVEEMPGGYPPPDGAPLLALEVTPHP